MADVMIIGGGPVGATLALGLAGSGVEVKVLEAREKQEQPGDPRAIALSEGSRLILERLGVWQGLTKYVTPIKTIHISQKCRFGRSLLKADEAGREALGYVVGYSELASAIDIAIQASGIKVLRGAVAKALLPGAEVCDVKYCQGEAEHHQRVALAVLADGGRSMDLVPGLIRHQREYGHSALVAHVETELPHKGVAYERFTPDGPIALLPWGERGFALVWTAAHERAKELCQMNAEEFLTKCHAHFGDRMGRFLAVSGRATFPLKLAWVRPVASQHLAVIGNAAQTLHPVAGQGFNLGLRDAWDLASLANNTPASELGAETMLKTYCSTRRMDTGGGMLFTDFLVRTFSNDWPGAGVLRGAGLVALDLCVPARHFVTRKMSLGARG